MLKLLKDSIELSFSRDEEDLDLSLFKFMFPVVKLNDET